MKAALPAISETERQALEVGDVWWDAELLSGKPDWARLVVAAGKFELNADEQAFVDGPVAELCAMIDDWEINFERRQLPDEIWAFLKEKQFFGIIIPEAYGGLGFSAAAHSEVVSRIATRSAAVAVTVMVPNSLGPGELLLEFGTQEQKDYYLPRLARGEEIPCFGLTSPEAGSDAAAMVDEGVVCRGDWKGEKVLGIRLNWHKRYITLGPVATLLGLAFKLRDPDGLLGGDQELGITLALIPTDLPGIDIGKRHLPGMQSFQNGPNWGKDVFIPLDHIIGGKETSGQGWEMLMTALSAGRSISLPALSAGAAKLATMTTGAYARIREQFHLPIGKFEGVQARLAIIVGETYLLEAGRRVTTLALDHDHTPSVVSAILKSQSTFRAREVLNHAMDVHGGKTVCDGPSNYLGNLYRAQPVAITVEGANILTRNLIIFGQGAIRCHPYLLKEILSVDEADEEKGLQQFESVIYKHVRYAVGNAMRSLGHGLTFGAFASKPRIAGPSKYYRKLSRYSAALSFVTEVALIHLGGDLKRKEMLSARLGDVLSELYLLSCVLKRFHSEDQPEADLPIIAWTCESGFRRIERSLDEVFSNYPSRLLGLLMRTLTFPLGRYEHGPSDSLSREVADLAMTDGPVRERLTAGVFGGNEGDGIYQLESAFKQVSACTELKARMRDHECATIDDALAANVIDKAEADRLKQADEAVSRAVAVDEFDSAFKAVAR